MQVPYFHRSVQLLKSCCYTTGEIKSTKYSLVGLIGEAYILGICEQ